MLYDTADAFRSAPHKNLLFFGMSGLGKSYVSNLLRESGPWFHYSIDYRIATRYMGEHIVDNFIAEAMKVPLLSELLMSDSIYIASNITDINLAPLSTYLGKPGDPSKGGLPFEEYVRRQNLHRDAEIAALNDTAHFIERSARLYGYPHFVADTGGSICEVTDPFDLDDPTLRNLSDNHLMIWIEGSAAHTAELVRRFDKAPKPMYYNPQFLAETWAQFLSENSVSEDKVDPDAFIRWAYVRAMEHRQPRYAAMADNFGIRLQADALAQARTADAVIDLIAETLGNGSR